MSPAEYQIRSYLTTPYAFATGMLGVVRAVFFGGALLLGTIWGIKEFG